MVFENNLNPIIMNLGPLEIRWYGVMYVLAFLFVYWYVKREIKEDKLKLSLKELDDLLVILVASMIAGARLFSTLIYYPGYYLAHPLEILYVWKGGLSFHGALLAMIIAALIYCKNKKINFLHLADVFIVPLALGQAFGR